MDCGFSQHIRDRQGAVADLANVTFPDDFLTLPALSPDGGSACCGGLKSSLCVSVGMSSYG